VTRSLARVRKHCRSRVQKTVASESTLARSCQDRPIQKLGGIARKDFSPFPPGGTHATRPPSTSTLDRIRRP
jgi:hypothetical protein